MKMGGIALRGSVVLAASVLLTAAPGVEAQDHADHGAHHANRHPALPDGWMAHFDQVAAEHAGHQGDADDGLSFVDMPPGWHVTTGPSGIFYRHEFRAEGSYTIESDIHLFDPGTRREAFGVFVGGSTLHDPAARRYTYFLVRRDGRYMIRERDGDEVRTIREWTDHAAVRGWDDRPEGARSVANTLTVRVDGSEVAFLVNGEEVDRTPRGALALDGHFGLRVNHALDLRVSRIEMVGGGGR